MEQENEDDDLPEPQAGGPGMTPEESMALIMSRPQAARNLGQFEGFAMAIGFIALGEWARLQGARRIEREYLEQCASDLL